MHDAVVSIGRYLSIIDEVHIRLIADVVSGCHLLHAEVALTTGIILRHLYIGYRMIDAVINHGVALAIECKVDGLAHLSALEQGGIALSRHLDNLVLSGVKCQLILTRLRVGLDGQRVAGYINLCGIGKFTIGILQSKGYHIVG